MGPFRSGECGPTKAIKRQPEFDHDTEARLTAQEAAKTYPRSTNPAGMASKRLGYVFVPLLADRVCKVTFLNTMGSTPAG